MVVNEETEKYISLREATKHCDYSQEYLSLRARQGKLKAVKFGRNWVTKKEWLDEYLLEIKEYNDVLNKAKKTVAPPRDLPIEKGLLKEPISLDEWAGLDLDFDFNKFKKALRPAMQIRFGLVVVFTTTLLVTNLVFGQESLQSVYDQTSAFVGSTLDSAQLVVADINKGVDDVLVDMSKGAQEVSDNVNRKTLEINEDIISYGDQLYRLATIEIPETMASLGRVVLDITETYNTADKFVDDKIIETYNAADKFVDDKIMDAGRKTYDITSKSAQKVMGFVNNTLSSINKSVKSFASEVKDGYAIADNFVDNKIFSFRRAVLNGLRFAVSPWTGAPVAFVPDEMEEIRTEIERLKEEGFPAKEIITEVSRITQVQPVKEITKEVIKVDEKALSLLEARVGTLEEEIVKRLYAPGGVVSQTVYMTQPVSSPRVYQQDGDIIFQTLGSGSVIMSAATGLQLSGQQVVIDSTSASNPLVYIADATQIRGPLTLNAPDYYTGNILDIQLNGTSLVSADEAGNLSIAGTTTFAGPLTLNVDSTTPALSITQAGTGDIISLSRTGGGSFVINEDGFIVGVGTLRIEEPGGEIWEMGVTASKLTYTTALTLASGGTGDIILDPASGIIQAATGDVYYTEGGHPIRESGEQMLREVIPIFGFDLPARTASTTYVAVSRVLEDYPFAAALTGTTRVHKFIIRYADTVTSGTSTWQVYNVTDSAQAVEFTVPYSASTDIDNGEAYITGDISIPTDTDDWRIDVKVASGSIQIYQIFLAAYDQVD